MPLATASQIRYAYQRVLARGLLATPRTVAQELGTSYSEASIAIGLERLQQAVSRQGDHLTASHTASCNQARECRHHGNDLARIRQNEQTIRRLEQANQQLTSERDACELKSHERQTELETLRQAAITTIATQQSQIKSLTGRCAALTNESDQLQTRLAEAETIYWETYLLQQMLQRLYQLRLVYAGTRIRGTTQWPASLSNLWEDTDVPKVERPEVTLALHQAHQYESQLKDEYDAIKERQPLLTEENNRLLKNERKLQRHIKNLTSMCDDWERRYNRIWNELWELRRPDLWPNRLNSDETDRRRDFRLKFMQQETTDCTETDNDE